MQRAHINKGLLIALGALALIVGGYWTWSYVSEPKIAFDPNAPEAEYNVYCSSCKKTTSMKISAIKSAARSPETNEMACPLCQKFTARAERKSGGSALAPGGG